MSHYLLSALGFAVLLLFSAFFSSAEIAFAKSNKLRFKMAAENGDKTAKIVQSINDRYARSLSTVLVGNDLVNIAASSLMTLLCIDIFKNRTTAETVATAVTTVLLLLFGETLPKILAAAVPDKTARLYAAPLRIFMYIFFPVVWAVNKIVELLSPLWTPREATPQVTPEELCEILEDIEEEGVFTEDEGDLIKSAIEFADTSAREILTPRVDVQAIDIDDPPDVTNELFRHSRVPVYRDTIDNIIGILPTKQLLKCMADGESYTLEELMLPPIFVHMTRTASSLIREFRQKHQQMALVVDEYGGTMGLVTMEDVAEELVGDIFDEHDEQTDEITALGDGVFEVDGNTNIWDLFDELDFEPPADFDTDCTTVGGWATETLDRFPVPGDSFPFARLTVTVTAAQTKRVLRLRVEVAPEPEEEEKD